MTRLRKNAKRVILIVLPVAVSFLIYIRYEIIYHRGKQNQDTSINLTDTHVSSSTVTTGKTMEPYIAGKKNRLHSSTHPGVALAGSVYISESTEYKGLESVISKLLSENMGDSFYSESALTASRGMSYPYVGYVATGAIGISGSLDIVSELQNFSETGKKGLLMEITQTITKPFGLMFTTNSSKPFSPLLLDYPPASQAEYDSIMLHTPAATAHFDNHGR